MKHRFLLFSILLSLCLLPAHSRSRRANPDTLRVLQWNIWQEGTQVPGGYDAIVDEIERLRPDFVTFSEVRNYHGSNFAARITASLAARGLTYYSFYSYDSGLLSRYPIADTLTVFPCNGDHGSIYGLHLTKPRGHRLAVYTAHLDYQDCAYYEPRGYDGNGWREMPPLVDSAEVIRRSDLSLRDDAIRLFIRLAERDAGDGYSVIIGGDFNEPSHLDWTSATRHLYDHRGLVVPWTVSTLLAEAGFVDVYRSLHPNPLTHPGFTYPSANPLVPTSRLTWAPRADERERIDFVYSRGSALRPLSAQVFGPEESIAYGHNAPHTAKSETILAPLGIWPTDHKGVFVEFLLP